MNSLATAAPPQAEVAIATMVSDIARDFLSLADSLTPSSRFSAQVAPATIHDEFSRFKLWAGNIAAHRKGRRSLEYRLRDATHLKTETHKLLDALSTALCDASAIVKGEKVPWDELSDSDSELSDDDSSDNDLQGSTQLKQLLASTKSRITSLFRLSMAIRDPAPNCQSKSTITIDKSIYEQHDTQHVEEKFRDAPTYLTERLGRAISGRRQYLSYREEHHQKLAKNIERIGFEKPTTEFTTNSTEATPIPGSERSNSLNVLDEGDDAASQTSYATSVSATIRVPPLPKKARNEDFFECPLCFILVSIHTATGWKQHVYRDLHPYCCTYEHCTTADRLYDSRKSWFAHELEAHRTSWQCIEGCGKTFQEESDFESHVRRNHADLASANMFSALKRTSAKSASLTEQAQCTLCGKNMSLRALQKHLGSHQQQLALFALPPTLDDSDDDPDDGTQDSLSIGDRDDGDLSDYSDELEPDVASDGDSDDINSDFLPITETAEDTGQEFVEIGSQVSGDSPPIDLLQPPLHEDDTIPSTSVPPQSAMMKLDKISREYHELVPSCNVFLANPSTDKTSRVAVHKMLSETIFTQMLMKLDGVGTDGDPEVRAKRKKLVMELHSMLRSLDQALARADAIEEAASGSNKNVELTEQTVVADTGSYVASDDRQRLSPTPPNSEQPNREGDEKFQEVIAKLQRSVLERQQSFKIEAQHQKLAEETELEDHTSLLSRDLAALEQERLQDLSSMEANLERLKIAAMSADADHEELGRQLDAATGNLNEILNEMRRENEENLDEQKVKDRMAHRRQENLEARQRAVDAYNLRRSEIEEQQASEEVAMRQRLAELGAPPSEIEAKLEEERNKRLLRDEEEYHAFLRKQKEKEAEGKASAEEELEEQMKQRLAEFGFEESQIETMTDQKEGITTAEGDWSSSSLLSATPSNESDVLYCDICNVQFKGTYRRGNLARHKRLHHRGVVDKYPCEDNHCKKVFARKDTRLKHYRKVHSHLAPDPGVSWSSTTTGKD